MFRACLAGFCLPAGLLVYLILLYANDNDQLNVVCLQKPLPHVTQQVTVLFTEAGLKHDSGQYVSGNGVLECETAIGILCQPCDFFPAFLIIPASMWGSG